MRRRPPGAVKRAVSFLLRETSTGKMKIKILLSVFLGLVLCAPGHAKMHPGLLSDTEVKRLWEAVVGITTSSEASFEPDAAGKPIGRCAIQWEVHKGKAHIVPFITAPHMAETYSITVSVTKHPQEIELTNPEICDVTMGTLHSPCLTLARSLDDVKPNAAAFANREKFATRAVYMARKLTDYLLKKGLTRKDLWAH